MEDLAMTKKINVAIVGMGFGAEFIPIYQRHPHTNMYAICQRNKEHLDVIGDKFCIDRRSRPRAADPEVTWCTSTRRLTITPG
jgi:predicted dehydrogenase